MLAQPQDGLFAAEQVVAPPIPDQAVEHGEIFTRRWMADLILDLAGYDSAADLASMVAVEPACGQGAFVVPMAARLSKSLRAHGRSLQDAGTAIRAFDLHPRNVAAAREAVVHELLGDGWEADDAAAAAVRWVIAADFLLMDSEPNCAHFVVGNPPYIRLEAIPEGRLALYRQRCATMRGRADIYVGFYEVGLRSLKPGGALAFICADRWMRNQYGARLRELIGSGYSLDLSLTAHDVRAFEEDVSAYPAVTVLAHRPQGPVVQAVASSAFGEPAAREFLRWSRGRQSSPLDTVAVQAARLDRWQPEPGSWPGGSPARLSLLADLNRRFRPLEDPSTGTRVGIGVASGADAVYLTTDPNLVEDDRLLPLAMAGDTGSGALNWSGNFLVNPWAPDGRLIELAAYPRLEAYFAKHRTALTRRNVAARNPSTWFRTIDRVEPGLADRPKLLLPDMKMRPHPVLETEGLYPHHNLYFVTSAQWDLEVLGGLLLSDVSHLFVDSYCVKMRGGTLRFQAQYLRRIRVPAPE